MKTLKTLVKLNKKILDEIVIDINKSETEKSLLLQRSNDLQNQIESEIESYHSSEYSFMLEQYLHDSRKKQQRIKAQIDRLNLTIEKLRQNLAKQYSELKKYEIALQNREKEESIKEQKSQMKSLDEFNTNRYSYKQN